MVQETCLFCQAQGLVGEVVVMEDLLDWEEEWVVLWVDLEDQVEDSLVEDPPSFLHHPTQDRITHLDLGGCLGLEAEVEEVVAEEAFLQGGHHNLTCHLISALPCTLAKALTLCCHLVEWVVVLEVVVLLIHVLECSNLSMDKEGIHSTALHCLGAQDLVVLPMAR